MARSYNQILSDVGDAVDYVRAQGGSVPFDVVADQTVSGGLLAELPDAAPINDYFASELAPCRPNTVRAATVEEFEMAYQALGYIHGGIDQAKVDTDIKHEAEHKLRADIIGFAYSGFLLTVTESVEKRIGWMKYSTSFSWKPSSEPIGPTGYVTKLALASIVAGPHDPSNGDTARLESMGYQGRADVAQRIITAPELHLVSLLLPEGFTRERTASATV